MFFPLNKHFKRLPCIFCSVLWSFTRGGTVWYQLHFVFESSFLTANLTSLLECFKGIPNTTCLRKTWPFVSESGPFMKVICLEILWRLSHLEHHEFLSSLEFGHLSISISHCLGKFIKLKWHPKQCT